MYKEETQANRARGAGLFAWSDLLHSGSLRGDWFHGLWAASSIRQP